MRVEDLSLYGIDGQWIENVTLSGFTQMDMTLLRNFILKIDEISRRRNNPSAADLIGVTVADFDLFVIKTPYKKHGDQEIFRDRALISFGWFLTQHAYRGIALQTVSGVVSVTAAEIVADKNKPLTQDGKYEMLHADFDLSDDPEQAIEQMAEVWENDIFGSRFGLIINPELENGEKE